MNQAFAPALVAFGIALAVTKLAEIVSRRRGLLDVPNDRSSHATPTPRIGGVGIIAGVVSGWLIAGGWQATEHVALMVAAGLLALVGLADDLGRSSLLGKYLAQLVGAGAVAIAIGPHLLIDALGVQLELEGLTATLAATLWLTALTNAFNFLDGIDGMLGSLTVVVSSFGIALVSPETAPNLVVAAGAALGFLAWNRPQASIFMGDVGSQFLGLWVGGSLLMQPTGATNVVPVLILCGLILLDTGLTLIRRISEGKNIFAAHREHMYQRLATAGTSHSRVTALYSAVTAFLGATALAWPAMGPEFQLATIMGLIAGGLGLTIAVARSVARAETERP